jgi:hypothetical protein
MMPFGVPLRGVIRDLVMEYQVRDVNRGDPEARPDDHGGLAFRVAATVQ